MSRRNNLDRCAGCRLHATLCICALVPQLRTRTRLALLVHYREARKPTNTGQLAARCLAGSTVEVVGVRDQPPPRLVVHGDELPVLLYPSDDAVPIARFAAHDRPIVLVVPDGNWRQAAKMRRRIAGLAEVPCVTLPATAPTAYRLRAEPQAEGLATFEAIARALAILEGDAGPALEAAMTAVFRVMVERTLWLRGLLTDGEVTGGIPAAALANDPRGTPAARSSGA